MAKLIMQQNELYKPHPDRVKRELPPAERSVLFVLDASASLEKETFENMTSLLADIALHLGGEVAVGMLTYSTHITLHFCPTCLRSDGLSEAQYRQSVMSRIQNVQHHEYFTLTGEVLKCLTNHVMADPDCAFLPTKPTHIMFITDGRDNGCQNVKTAAQELLSEYNNTEIYAIGIGNILTSGVADVQTGNSPNIFFNFETPAQLVSSWDTFKSDYIQTGIFPCLPVDFSK